MSFNLPACKFSVNLAFDRNDESFVSTEASSGPWNSLSLDCNNAGLVGVEDSLLSWKSLVSDCNTAGLVGAKEAFRASKSSVNLFLGCESAASASKDCFSSPGSSNSPA